MKKLLNFCLVVALVLAGPGLVQAATTLPSSPIHLVVNPLPVATVNGQLAINAYVGDVLNLSVTAPGTSTVLHPFYSWTVSGGALSSAIVTAPTWDTAALAPGDYTASCIVTNDLGPMASNSVLVHLFALPVVDLTTTIPVYAPVSTDAVWTALTSTFEVNSGTGAVTMTATVTGHIGVINSYAWYKDGVLIFGQSAQTLVLSPLDATNTAAYTATADVTP